MRACLKSWESKRLSLRQMLSLHSCLRRLGYQPRPRSVKPRAKKRTLWLKMTPYSKRCLTVSARMLPSFVRRVCELSPRRNEPALSGFWTSLSGAHCLYHLATTGPSPVAGPQQRVAPSTCKTSSEVRSYAKRSWHRWGTSLSSGTFRRLNREYSRGLRITKICSTSSGLAVTLMPRSVLRCSTYRAFQKKVIQTLDSLQSRRCSAAGTGLAGRLSLPNFSLDSLAHRPFATTRTSPKSWGSTRRTSSASSAGKTTSRSSGKSRTRARRKSS